MQVINEYFSFMGVVNPEVTCTTVHSAGNRPEFNVKVEVERDEISIGHSIMIRPCKRFTAEVEVSDCVINAVASIQSGFPVAISDDNQIRFFLCFVACLSNNKESAILNLPTDSSQATQKMYNLLIELGVEPHVLDNRHYHGFSTEKEKLKNLKSSKVFYGVTGIPKSEYLKVIKILKKKGVKTLPKGTPRFFKDLFNGTFSSATMISQFTMLKEIGT